MDITTGTTSLLDVTSSIVELAKPEKTVNVQVCKIYKFVLSFWINGLLCLFGIGGNILSMIVLQKITKKSGKATSATILMMALLVADILVLIMMAAMKSVPALCTFVDICKDFFAIYPYYLIWGWPLTTVAHALSTWMIMLLTIHRYIAVCYPHKAALWGKPRQVISHIILFTIFTIAFIMPTFVNDYIEKRFDPETNTTKLYKMRRDFSAGKSYNVIYTVVLYYMVTYAIPLGTISFLTFFLMRTLKRSRAFRRQMTQRNIPAKCPGMSNKEDDHDNILLSIIFVYLCTQVWEPIRRIIENYSGNTWPQCGEFRYYFDEIPSLMAVISSSMNFVIYCSSGKRMRGLMKEMFWCCFRKELGNSESGEPSSGLTGSTNGRANTTTPANNHM